MKDADLATRRDRSGRKRDRTPSTEVQRGLAPSRTEDTVR